MQAPHDGETFLPIRLRRSWGLFLGQNRTRTHSVKDNVELSLFHYVSAPFSVCFFLSVSVSASVCLTSLCFSTCLFCVSVSLSVIDLTKVRTRSHTHRNVTQSVDKIECYWCWGACNTCQVWATARLHWRMNLFKKLLTTTFIYLPWRKASAVARLEPAVPCSQGHSPNTRLWNYGDLRGRVERAEPQHASHVIQHLLDSPVPSCAINTEFRKNEWHWNALCFWKIDDALSH